MLEHASKLEAPIVLRSWTLSAHLSRGSRFLHMRLEGVAPLNNEGRFVTRETVLSCEDSEKS